MALSIRLSSTTAGGTATATSLGGRPAATGPTGTTNTYWDAITTAQNDAGHTDYRALFIYNNGTTVMNNVTVTLSNKGGGSTVTVAACSVATAAFASYVINTIASETTAPTQVGTYANSVNLGTLNAGQVKAIWFKRVQPVETAAVADELTFVVSADEVIPA